MFELSEKVKNQIAEKALRYFGKTKFEEQNAFFFLNSLVCREILFPDDHDWTHIKDWCKNLEMPYRGIERFRELLKKNFLARKYAEGKNRHKPKPPA